MLRASQFGGVPDLLELAQKWWKVYFKAKVCEDPLVYHPFSV